MSKKSGHLPRSIPIVSGLSGAEMHKFHVCIILVRNMRRNKMRDIIGVDEAGRGPLAGPIVVAGVRMKRRLTRTLLRGIKDSKKLSAKKRDEWYLRLTAHPGVAWAVSRISPLTIDRINIGRAGLRGVLLVHRRLSLRGSAHVLLDGGLFLPNSISQETIIKGDEKIPVIAAASIIAKVTRDRIMRRIHKKYPQYRFDLHKGYGTVFHRALIGKFGRSPVHRASFRMR